MSIRILIADDHRMIRAGLHALLRAEEGMEVIAEAEHGRTAVKLVGELRPDVVVMDICMPDLNGIEATRQAIAAKPDVKVIALSAFAERRLMTEVLRAGARGYLSKDDAFEELAGAIRTVVDNKVYLSPRLAGALVQDHVRVGATAASHAADGHSAGGASVFDRLSAREREVLQLMAEGHATKQVAAHLHVSVKTVETHRAKIMDKLDIHSVAELTKYAVREGLTSLYT